MTATVVALHGFTSGPRLFDPLRLPDHGIHLHAPWLTGHGPDPDLSGEEFDDELERLIEEIDEIPAPRHLLGYSMGARVGLGLAVRYPEVFRSVTLVGVNPGLTTPEERQERQQWEDRWTGMLEDDGLAVFEHNWSKMPLFATQSEVPRPWAEHQRQTRLSHTARGLVHALQVLGLANMPDHWSHLPMIACPTKLVVGQFDTKFLGIAQRAVELMLDAEVVSVDGSGHNPILERPEFVQNILFECMALGDADPISVRFRDG